MINKQDIINSLHRSFLRLEARAEDLNSFDDAPSRDVIETEKQLNITGNTLLKAITDEDLSVKNITPVIIQLTNE